MVSDPAVLHVSVSIVLINMFISREYIYIVWGLFLIVQAFVPWTNLYPFFF